ncbi:MAG: biopolymer transporter ExbD [Citromicrobium sp.]|nr:MAG: biopolymer transporter ExbD [Citromicrobium sp.]
MAMSGGKDDGAPMIEMNMTPLIDVLLVLLIMFIITIPVATHSVDIDLPQPNPNPPPVDVEPDKNKLVISQQDELFWNGEQITDGDLMNLLDQSANMEPEPELQYEPEALASYDRSAKVLEYIKASGVTSFGFVGNERYRAFGKSGGQP